ncbi:Transport protein [Gracilaria domingensis]|nr:Transport protein [Gracilaria domingensis]
MDTGGSFLDFACVRVALIPAGPALSDQRFEELTSYLTWLREIPTSALPRRSAVPRASTNATYTSMPTAYQTWAAANESALLRSRSSVREASRGNRRNTLLSLKPVSSRSVSSLSASDTASAASTKIQGSASAHIPKAPKSNNTPTSSDDPTDLAPSKELSFDIPSGGSALSVAKSSTLPRARTAPSVALGHVSDLNLNCPDVDSCFRLRYEVLHRDSFGSLLARTPSEWDAFHSSRVWAVFAVADVTSCENVKGREKAIDEARMEFVSSLGQFRDAPVKRLIIFVPHDEEHNRSFVEEEHLATEKNGDMPIFYSVGYVPEQQKVPETRLEVRAHLYQCASTLLSVIDRDCFKKRENPSAELILSPIDERHGVDRQPKLSKRRPGRLDKVQGDYLLLMGRPGDALVKYNSAIERAKSNSDRLWLAGAMEAWSAAHVLLYVGAGGSLNDSGFCDRLIDHYAEIFKLYQKKRVTEPEAAAALRLAEFLGKWTNRRKEALDAAEHAATVGEGLRAQKRAALWEALARFSERMGCRRKAGMYLYRLGHLYATQSNWPSAVALMSAAERQLSPQGFKSWPDLSRKLLLTAANHAIGAGDSTTAARLYAEALIISPLSRKKRRETDEIIVTALRKAHVPPFLPGIGEILDVSEIQALQAQDLFLRRKESQLPSSKGVAADVQKAGPFIYNAFEINEERRRAAAAARRSVTWVRGEAAQVSMSLCNRTATDLVVDLIAVLMSDENEAKDSVSEVVSKSAISLTESSSRIWVDEEQSSVTHAAEVRALLDESKRIAKTKSETIAIPLTEGTNGSIRNIEVVPKQTGSFHIEGLLVRLFDGVLVILRPKTTNGQSFQVNVIDKLPRITLTSYSSDGEAMESISPRKPLCVFHGESRSFLVEMKNSGPVKIKWASGKVKSSHPDVLHIASNNLSNQDIREGLENVGDIKSFTVEVLGKCSNLIAKENPFGSKLQAGPKVSVQVEYEGEDSKGMIRESKSFVRINSKPAVVIRKVNIFLNHPRKRWSSCEGQRLCIFAIEVSNEVAAPATIKVDAEVSSSQALKQSNATVRDNMNMDSILSEECFVESGASARLLCNVTQETLNQIRARSMRSSLAMSEEANRQDVIFTVIWSLPALGRKGKLPFTSFDLWKLVHRNRLATEIPLGEAVRSLSNIVPALAEVQLRIEKNCKRRAPHYENPGEQIPYSSQVKVQVGCFWPVQILVRNLGDHQLPESCVLDVELKQLDADADSEKLHRASLVGVVERIFVGALVAHEEDFIHCIRVRVDSVGTFHLIAYLYEANSLAETGRGREQNSGPVPLEEAPNPAAKRGSGSEKLTPKNVRYIDTTAMPSSATSDSFGLNNMDSTIVNKIDRHDSQSTPIVKEKQRKRVHIGRVQESESDSGTTIRPVTVDTYSSSSTNKIRGRPLAVAVVEFSAERKSDSNYLARPTPYYDTMGFDEHQPGIVQHQDLERAAADTLYQSTPAKG